MDSLCEPPPRRVNVQSIRERFEVQSRRANDHRPSSEADSGSSNASESDNSTGFQPQNRTSIKRSPAFRTDDRKPGWNRRAGPAVHPVKKPSLKRKPGVQGRTCKPNLDVAFISDGNTTSLKGDTVLEEALKAPLPTGPAPKKPPRTFQHDMFMQQSQQQQQDHQNGIEDETDGSSPRRPQRRTKALAQRTGSASPPSKPAAPQRPASIATNLPYTMTRSKTEPFLQLRKKSAPCPAVEPAGDDAELLNNKSRWMNPVQWNSISPPSPIRRPLNSSRMSLTISPAKSSKTRSPPIMEPRRMSCDYDRRRPSDFQQRSRKEHVYDEPSVQGDLHYMCSPIVEVGNVNGWNRDHRITDDSDCESENEFKKSQLVEDRKIYIRRVSSNVCDLRKSVAIEPGAGLYEIFLEVALFYDRQLHRHTPYIKSSYPSQAVVPSGVERFCFPDSTHWPPPHQTANEPYTIVLTDSKGDRLFGYCRRVVPEGAHTCIPITYCLLTRHRAAGFYNKLLNVMVSRHGVAVSQRLALLDCLHKQPFPNPGRFVEFPAETPGANNKVNKVQRLLDGRLEDIDLRVLFERLNETVVLHVLGTVLLERKLIFVSQNLSILSLCVDAVQSMLYPFVWQHTVVPVLPQSMTEISAAPTPFILGILSKNVDDWKALYPDQGMLVDLDNGKVLYCVGDESTILPRRSVRKLMSDWEVTVTITQQAESARNALYSESFLRMFVDLCGHYEQHIHSTESGHKYFERAAFARNHTNSGVRDFLEWFTETAMFNLFIESRLRHDAVQTLYEHKILEHSMQLVRPQLILPNSKVLGRKIKTIGDKLREMNMFA